MKNHHFLSSWIFHLRIFKYFFMWIHRLWLEFPKWYVCSKWEIFKNNDSPYLGLESLASGSIYFFLYTHHCLYACETEVQKHWLCWCGPSDGPEVQPDQEIMCVAWIGLFGILGNVGERKEVGFKEEMFTAHQNHLFPSSNDFLLRHYFHLLPTSTEGLQ